MNGTPASARYTGDPFVAVDADLAELANLPLDDQPPVFDRIHSSLTAILATTSSDGGPSGGGR